MSSDPYATLGVSPSSTDEAIRRRYLELVRLHGPERDPQRFVEVRAAYEKLSDPVRRLHYALFEAGKGESIEAIRAALRAGSRRRIPVRVLLAAAEEPHGEP
jgi:curved DNA-binding protein CbpA